MQKLEIFQSLWAMERSNADGTTPSLSAQIDKIKAAGFDGVDIVFGDVEKAAISPLLAECDLACSITAFPDSVEALSAAIDMALEVQARHINIIGKVYPFTVGEGAAYVRSWMALCESAGLPMTIETHRDCLTTDMHYCLQLLASVPEMRLCADLSHYVVGREFSWPITDEVEEQIATLLDRSVAFQGRVASREQIQLQISFAHHQEWYNVFANWWLRGFRSWRQRSAEDATLNFLCELGPPEYAMSDSSGAELSSRWDEAIMLRQRVLSLWEQSAAC